MLYAHRDGRLIDVRGFDPDNIIDLKDATQGEMTATFDSAASHEGRRLKFPPDRLGGASALVVFYSGQGVPGTDGKSPVIRRWPMGERRGDGMSRQCARWLATAAVGMYLCRGLPRALAAVARYLGRLLAVLTFAVAWNVLFAVAAVGAAPVSPDGVAVIIGNRNYEHAHEVRFAHRDADAFRSYVIDVLGFDEERILDYRDASLAEVLDVFGAPGHWERTALWSLLDIDGRSDVVVFYSGHGMPGRDGRGYLLPADGHPARPQLNGYAIETLEENLSNLNARSFALYLDACFLGSSHAGALVSNVSGVWRERPLPGPSAERMVVLTAASATETAFWDEDAGHGMFTHHLLDALYGAADADGDARVTTGEAHAYVRRQVATAVRRQHRDNQTPGLRGAGGRVLALARSGGFPPRPVVASAGPRAQPFTVLVEPAGARVRVLNIEERYRPGMELPAGEYRVEASREGYETATEDVRHGAETATEYRIALRRSARQWTAGERFRDCPDCPEMVVIPAGRFSMGCVWVEAGQDCPDSEKPVRALRIGAPFALSMREVTFREWGACVSGGGCGAYVPSDSGWGRGERPVTAVNWYDARSYAEWLSRHTGETYRLPSEAEWEYAARGSRTGSRTYYHFGNADSELCRYANHADRSTDFRWRNRSCSDGFGEMTAPTGSFESNGFGLHDMHGNVDEWVEDCAAGYTYAVTSGDGNESVSLPGDCPIRVSRGGSWRDHPWGLRASERNFYYPGGGGPSIRGRYSTLGFRVARALTR